MPLLIANHGIYLLRPFPYPPPPQYTQIEKSSYPAMHPQADHIFVIRAPTQLCFKLSIPTPALNRTTFHPRPKGVFRGREGSNTPPPPL